MQKVNKNLKKSGIYCILNLKNQKKYIGSSRYIYDRICNHKMMLKNNKHHNNYLQNSWNKNKSQNFIYIILEYCEKDILIEREQFYIDNLKPEYNFITDVINNIITGKKIYQYTLEGKFIKEYDYIKQACLENNIHQSTICRFLNGTYNKGGDYLWSLDYKKSLTPYKKYKKDNSYMYKKVIVTDTMTNKTYKTFNSLKECALFFGYFPSEISKGIKNGRKFKRKYLITKATLHGDM